MPPRKFANLGNDLEAETQEVKPAKKPSKSGNADWRMVTIYLRKDTHHRAKVRLVQENTKDLSDLMQQLLQGWLDRHPNI